MNEEKLINSSLQYIKYERKKNKELISKNRALKEQIKILTKDDEIQQQVIIEQKQRIDKAIEFLHNNTMIGHCKEHYELLKILGDKENE